MIEKNGGQIRVESELGKAQLFISLSRDNMENGYFVTPDNTPLYYTVLGHGSKPLILLHGGLP